jgi:nicotinamidase-related amidase
VSKDPTTRLQEHAVKSTSRRHHQIAAGQLSRRRFLMAASAAGLTVGPLGAMVQEALAAGENQTINQESRMHEKAFMPDNAAMLLIDHQLGTMSWTHSHDINLVKQNAIKLAKIAKAVSIPTVLTSSMEDKVQGPLMPELEQILPEAFAARIRRPGIVNAMHHEGFNKAVKATGRKKLFVAGITTEICVLFPVLQMLDEGYEVQVSADASASYTKYGDDIALRRMENSGAIITTMDQIVSELAIDWTTPNGSKLSGILAYH